METGNNPTSPPSLSETALRSTRAGDVYSAAMLALAAISIAALGWFGADLVLSNMTESICHEELSRYGEFNAVVISLAFVTGFVWSAFATAVVLTSSDARVWWVSFYVSVSLLVLLGAWQIFVLFAIGWCQ